MKIALCISGQPRGLINNIPKILENLITPNNITDIFIHTWYDKSCDNKNFDSAQPGLDNFLGCWLPDTDKILINNLSPLKIECDTPKNFEELSHLTNLSTAVQTKLASNFYSVWKCNELKKKYEIDNNFIYDVVIKTRVDLSYHHKIIIDNIVDTDLDTCVYVPYMHQYMRQNDSYPISTGGNYGSLSDTFVIGNSANIDKVSSVYPNFVEIYEKINPFSYGECYIGYQVKHISNLSIKLSDIRYNINRV